MPLIDLHTHTRPLSHDSDLTPDDVIDAAKRSGLDGVCLTEHDFFWEHDKVAELARKHNFLVLPGIEVNVEQGTSSSSASSASSTACTASPTSSAWPPTPAQP